MSVSVVRNPPGWEVGIYLVGFFVLLGVAGLNIWKLWKSGTFPAPSPFPNFDYRYLQEKYGTSFSEVRQKVHLHSCFSEKKNISENVCKTFPSVREVRGVFQVRDPQSSFGWSKWWAIMRVERFSFLLMAADFKENFPVAEGFWWIYFVCFQFDLGSWASMASDNRSTEFFSCLKIVHFETNF